MSTIQIQLDRDGEHTLPVFRALSERMELVRRKAYERFERRGGSFGRELDDWVSAEHEVLGWPAAELKESDGAFEVDVTLPGFTAQDVELTATPSELVVHAATTHERKGDDERIVWSEFGSNDVYRAFGFPQRVNTDKVSASLENGILHVRAPKLEELEAAAAVS